LRIMSRTVAFGRDVLNAPDVDIEDLLACLSPSEVVELLDELASDPDDKHVPPSVRNSYRCEKDPTGRLDRRSLITFIKEDSLASPDREELVEFEAGLKRGKVFVPVLTKEEQEQERRKAEIAEKVKLDPEEEEALASASLKDIMALADILNTNPQNFIMEAYADPLKYYEPDPPNTTDPKEVADRLAENDEEVKDVNLNNIAGMEEREFCDLFDTLRKNTSLTKLSVVNCQINDFAASNLCLALEENKSLKSLNLEGNKISPDTLAALFESIAVGKSGLLEIRVAGQQQEKMGHRVEMRIADAVVRNPRLLKVGIKFEFKEAMNRVCQHLIRNCDKTRLRKKAGLPVEEDGGVVEDGVVKEWTQARNLEDGVEEVEEDAEKERGQDTKDKLIEGEEEPGEQRGEQES